MGNKLVKKRQVVDERYTRPQGLYELSKAVDHKKLRKLILESKLAPCYPGTDERGFDLEECPICFMYYPSLNRSKCKAYVQMKPSHSTFLEECTRCPFCKASNYAVEYCGLKTIEEKIVEQIEEQKVIEAKIRMRQQELLDEKERQQGRDGGFDVDPDYIMLMEAVWLSIQEHDSQMRVPCEELAGSRGSGPEYHHIASDFAPREPSSSAGLAFTIASMVERQIIDAGSSSSRRPDEQTRSRYIASSEDEGTSTTRHRRVQGDWIDISLESGRLLYGEDAGWMTDQRSKVAEASTSRASSGLHSVSGATTEYSPSMLDHDVYSNYIPTIDGGILPESFEEQIMLAMAISLAEARGQSTLRGS